MSKHLTMLRETVQNFLKSDDLESAIFLQEKVCIITEYHANDFFTLINLLMRAHRHKCALGLMRARSTNPLWAQILTARCLAAVEHCSEALDSLSVLIVDHRDPNPLHDAIAKIKSESPFIDPFHFLADALFLKGSLLEYSGHVDSTLYYAYSLICNPFKYCAARKLLEDDLLTPNETSGLLEAISKFSASNNSFSPQEISFILDFYKYFIQKDYIIHNRNFEQSWDIRRWNAKRFIDSRDSKNALRITSEIMNESSCQDPATAIIHGIGLYQNLSSSELQIFAVKYDINNGDQFASKAIVHFLESLSFLAMGTPNDAQDPIQKTVKATWNAVIRQQPYTTSTSLLFLVQGCASWNSGDNENALASFVSAADSSPSSIWAWLCIGVLNLRNSLYSLALPNLTKAHKISKMKNFQICPVVVNEMACCLFFMKRYEAARDLLEKLVDKDAQKKFGSIIAQHLPVFYLNLAHACFRLKRLKEAVFFANEGLAYNHRSSALMRLLGFLADLEERHEEAQLWYHRSLLQSPQLTDLIPKNPEALDYTTIPPETNYRLFRQQDIFCLEMLKVSM